MIGKKSPVSICLLYWFSVTGQVIKFAVNNGSFDSILSNDAQGIHLWNPVGCSYSPILIYE